MTSRDTRTSVAEHRATGAIEGAVPNPAWMDKVLQQCQRDVALAKAAIEHDNFKGAVTNAYDALRAAVECHMNASKLRIANRTGAHIVAIDYAAGRMIDIFSFDQVDEYDALRRVRHAAEYAFSSTPHTRLTRADADAAIKLADDVVRGVIRWRINASKTRSQRHD